LSLADLHLAPMMVDFVTAEEGHAMLARHPELSAWWELMRSRLAIVETEPNYLTDSGSISIEQKQEATWWM
jgi:glutathione S-transferase